MTAVAAAVPPTRPTLDRSTPVRPIPARQPLTRPTTARQTAARGAAAARDSLLQRPARRAAPLPSDAELASRADQEQGHEELRRARSLAAVVAVACVEVESGRRPLRDLAAWLTPEVFDKVSRRLDLLRQAPSAATATSAPRPVGARVCDVGPGRLEASATVVCDGRARAFALRIERRLSRWRVTTLEIG